MNKVLLIEIRVNTGCYVAGFARQGGKHPCKKKISNFLVKKIYSYVKQHFDFFRMAPTFRASVLK